MGRIVVGVDGSENASVALRWALQESALRGDTLEVVAAWHYPYASDVGYGFAPAVDPTALENAAAEGLEQALRDACPDKDIRSRVERVVVQGSAANNLIEAAKGADLLVVGTRGRGGFRGLLLGSVSTQCVHHAPCPVAVIPHDETNA
jgi:nucleotide-binding universal stress UspA family protein